MLMWLGPITLLCPILSSVRTLLLYGAVKRAETCEFNRKKSAAAICVIATCLETVLQQYKEFTVNEKWCRAER